MSSRAGCPGSFRPRPLPESGRMLRKGIPFSPGLALPSSDAGVRSTCPRKNGANQCNRRGAPLVGDLGLPFAGKAGSGHAVGG